MAPANSPPIPSPTSDKVHEPYEIVRVSSGEYSIRSLTYGETFHPVVGPVAEAQSLYVRQLHLPDRIASIAEPFVVWDVGLGAAANSVTLIHALKRPAKLKIISFDCTPEPLAFALKHTAELSYLKGFEAPLYELLQTGITHFISSSGVEVVWEFIQADFPELLKSSRARSLPPPHAIFYDAYSPATNTPMWTLPVFTDLYGLLDPERPCSMPTYSRSTLLRVTLLLAGFYVGVGHGTGEKEETTIAANQRSMLSEPLGPDWLLRARRSRSAEPILEGSYVQRSLSEASWEKLRQHPQFSDSVVANSTIAAVNQ